MKKLLCIFFALMHMQSFTQEDYTLKPPRDYEKNPAKNSAYVELGGNGGLYSLNFERIYLYKNNLKLSARFGFCPQLYDYYFEQIYILENNLILFSNPHHLEFGIGSTMQRRYNEHCNQPNEYFWENLWFGVFRCGYRFQKQDDGFFLRAGITPVLMEKTDCGFNPNYFQGWLGVAVGMNF